MKVLWIRSKEDLKNDREQETGEKQNLRHHLHTCVSSETDQSGFESDVLEWCVFNVRS